MYDGNGLPIHGMLIDKERNIEVDNNIIKITLKDKIENVPEFCQHFIVEKGSIITMQANLLSNFNTSRSPTMWCVLGITRTLKSMANH